MTSMSMADWGHALVGFPVEDYVLGDTLGAGEFCVVLEGRSLKTGQKVAIKVLPPTPNPQFSEEFDREGALLRKLSRSAGVVDVYGSGNFSMPATGPNGMNLSLSFGYHVLEAAQGNLEELVVNRDTLCWSDRISLWRGAVLGTHQMHLKGIAHRDLKSSNILVFLHGKNRTSCKVSDLGRSRDMTQPANHSLFQYQQGLGDLRFAPPEFLFFQGRNSNESHKLSDLYGLGSVLFELATGQSITSVAFGHGPSVAQNALTQGARNRSVDLSYLRGTYAPAYDLLESSFPAPLRDRGMEIVRQLCDPVPLSRLPLRRGSRNIGKDKGLEWLLLQADILHRLITRSPQKVHRRQERMRGA